MHRVSSVRWLPTILRKSLESSAIVLYFSQIIGHRFIMTATIQFSAYTSYQLHFKDMGNRNTTLSGIRR